MAINMRLLNLVTSRLPFWLASIGRKFRVSGEWLIYELIDVWSCCCCCCIIYTPIAASNCVQFVEDAENIPMPLQLDLPPTPLLTPRKSANGAKKKYGIQKQNYAHLECLGPNVNKACPKNSSPQGAISIWAVERDEPPPSQPSPAFRWKLITPQSPLWVRSWRDTFAKRLGTGINAFSPRSRLIAHTRQAHLAWRMGSGATPGWN